MLRLTVQLLPDQHMYQTGMKAMCIRNIIYRDICHISIITYIIMHLKHCIYSTLHFYTHLFKIHVLSLSEDYDEGCEFVDVLDTNPVAGPVHSPISIFAPVL